MTDMTRIFIPSGIDSLTLIDNLGKVKAKDEKEEGDSDENKEEEELLEQEKKDELLPFEDVIKQSMFFQQQKQASGANRYKGQPTTDLVKAKSWQLLLNELNKTAVGGVATHSSVAVSQSIGNKLAAGLTGGAKGTAGRSSRQGAGSPRGQPTGEKKAAGASALSRIQSKFT